MNIEQYAKRKQFYSDEVPPLLSECLTNGEWESLADLGCGDGSLIYALNQRGYFQGKSVFAVDLSQNRIDRVNEQNSGVTCLVADACDTGLGDSSIDLLLSTQVIEHVEDDGEMAKEMFRILSPGGTIYLSTVFKKRYAWYFYRCNGKWTLDPTHLREYTQDKQLVELLESGGFEIVANEKTLDGRPIIDSVLRRLRVGKYVYRIPLMKLLRKVRVPIPGYYIWELVLQKKELNAR
jgi:2-polyprenyl-3-methyl-5-hydroxy-6-metoxy-1,4-benzoquinol methylase